MGLIDCPDCKSKVSDIAPACPHCGRPFEHENSIEEKVAGEPDDGREKSDAIKNEGKKSVPPIIEEKEINPSQPLENAKAENRSYIGWVIGCLGVLLLFGAIGISALWIAKEKYDNDKKGEQRRKNAQYDIRVDESSIAITQSGGVYYVTGVAQNYSDQNYEQVEIEIDLYDAQGQLIGSTIDFTNVIGPSTVWNFQAACMRTNATSAKINRVIVR